MKRKPLLLAMAAVLAAGGGWLAWSGRHADSPPRSAAGGGAPAPEDRPEPGQRLRPPDPTRRFTDFTPEQRVEFARRGHGPGG